MFASRARTVPDIAPARIDSSTVSNETVLPSRLTRTSRGTDCLRVPNGPFTAISPSATLTSTPAGIVTGCFPILDISIPLHRFHAALRHDAQHFPAHPGRARLAVGHHAARGGHDGDPQSVHDVGDVL